MYHTPFLYKNFHKLHHKYKQPTAFSVTAIHPVEIMHTQMTLCLPLFLFPVHWRKWIFLIKIYFIICNLLNIHYTIWTITLTYMINKLIYQISIMKNINQNRNQYGFDYRIELFLIIIKTKSIIKVKSFKKNFINII